MKKASLARLLAVLIVTSVSFSCNRGYGCPTNFSMEDALDIAVNLMASFLF